jgi:hypothetical protein
MKHEMKELTEMEMVTVIGGSTLADNVGIGSAAGGIFGGLIGVNLWGLGVVVGATIVTGGGILALAAAGGLIGAAVGFLAS